MSIDVKGAVPIRRVRAAMVVGCGVRSGGGSARYPKSFEHHAVSGVVSTREISLVLPRLSCHPSLPLSGGP